MNQTQPNMQVALVIENPEYIIHATAALAGCGECRWTELCDCGAAVEWLERERADVVVVLLDSDHLDGLARLREVWTGPLLCFCSDDEGVLDAVNAAHALALVFPFSLRQSVSALRYLANIAFLSTVASPSTVSSPGVSPASPLEINLTAEQAWRETERRLEQAQRMEAVGRLAGGIAHDFNNLLTVIGSYSDLALRKLDDGDSVGRYVQQIRKASITASGLTRQLLAFSRRQVLQPRVIVLNEVVEEIGFMVQSLLGTSIELRIKLDPQLGQIEADPVQLQQVLLNLIVNSKDAMPDGGMLNIETRNIELDERYAQRFLDMRPGNYVRLTVADTGIGMDEETLARIYEPFFTTKPKGQGTGLGLPTVYGIVQQSGGYISVYSEVDKGTTFHVYLPRVNKAIDLPVEDAGVDGLAGRETILLVEDEPGVRELAALVLKEAGYHLLVAATPEEAIAIESTFIGEIDLLLTDVIMPRMTGREMAVKLAERRPQTPVVYMSGYTEDVMVFQQLLDIGALLIQKPFYPQDLLRMVRRAIEHPSAQPLASGHFTVATDES
jgi:signal transduction histidine kinase/ActR/RegA family two-component response regulator